MNSHLQDFFLGFTMDIYKKRTTVYDRLRPTAKFNIMVSGFSEQRTVTVDNVIGAADQLPRFHLSGIQEIRYQEDHTYFSRSGADPISTPDTTKAAFIENDKVVVIHEFNDLGEFQHMLYHEIGHHVFTNILNGSQRKRWVTELHPGSAKITPYAKTNAQEDFAECYASFIIDPKQLERYTRKYQYMRDEVFGGISVNLSRNHLDLSL